MSIAVGVASTVGVVKGAVVGCVTGLEGPPVPPPTGATKTVVAVGKGVGVAACDVQRKS